MQTPNYQLISSEAARPVPKAEKPDKPHPPPNLEHASAIIAEKIDHDEEAKVPNSLELKTGLYEYPSRARFAKADAGTVPIPRAIMDQIKTVEYRLFAGLFPEINRAYITLDDKLFLWNFEGATGQEFTTFTASQIIISVALVRPRPEVFVEEIRFLLVVATATEIRILGAIFEEGKACSDARIELHPTSFMVPSDGVHMIAICGTDNGRIFMCGRDGCVYELVYQSQDGWFTRKCRKLNHSSSKLQTLLPSFVFGGGEDPILDVISDNTRTPNLLITLARSSEIQVFSLGPQGDSLIPLSKYNASRLQSEVKSHIGNSTFTPAHWEIVSLARVPEVEARQGFAKKDEIIAMAITTVGHRIYFQRNTSTSFGTNITSDLKVHCVRQCPKQTRVAGQALGRTREPGWSDESPEHVRKTYYGNGIVLLADGKEASDSLVAISRDPAVGNRLVEYVEVLNLPQTRISDIVEVRPQFYLRGLANYLTARGQKEPLVGLSEFATQHEVPCREFMVLTSTSLQKFVKLRPVDELVSLLKSRSSDLKHKERTDALKAFAQHYTLQEFCAMCLVIVCSGPREVGDPVAGVLSPGARAFVAGPSDTEQLRLEATHAFFEFSAEGQAPVLLSSRLGITARPTTMLTDRAAGVALFMSRVLRAVWEKPIYQIPGRLVWAAKQKPLLERLQDQIRALTKFLDDKRFWLRPLLGQPEAEEMRDKEEESFRNMRHLLDRSLEALALLVALAEQSNITQIFQRLPPQHLEVLKDYDFSRLVTKGEQLGEALVKAVMQPGQKEDWVRSLQQRCPTYFGQSQMFLYKGDDCVEEAFINFSSQKIRMRCLAEAMQHYSNAVRIPRFDLEGVCSNLRRVHFYAGAVDLCQLRAQYIEEETELPVDQRELEKERCTENILETLNALQRKELVDPAKEETIRLTPAEKEKSLELVIQRALYFPDEKFHRAFYTWFIEHPDMTQYLLRMESPYLLRFLDESQDKKSKRILQDYLVANQHYAEAARFLYDLAKTSSREYTLDERVEFLSHALHYARMCQDPENPHQKIDGGLVFTIGDQLELCRIQKMIYENLRGIPDVPYAQPCPGGLPGSCPSHKFACLDQQLFTIDPLYHNYAENFQLWEAILKLLQFEGALKEHTATISATWKNIIVRAIRADKPNFNLWRQKLELSIKALYQQYHQEPELFPLKLVVEEVQRCHADKRWVARQPMLAPEEPDLPADWGWVVDCFLKAKVHPSDLLPIYEQLLEVPQVIGAEKEAVLWSCYRLLLVLSEPQNQRTYGTAGHNLLRACEDELSSRFDESPSVLLLKRKFAEVKARYGRERDVYY